MEKTLNSNEIENAEKAKQEKESIIRDIIGRRGAQMVALPKEDSTKLRTLDLEVDVDISKLYEAMSTFFNGLANVFNQFANNCNAASNNFKDEAIRILRERAEKETSEN